MKEITITSRSGQNTVIEIGMFDEIKIISEYLQIHRQDTPRDSGYSEAPIALKEIQQITFEESPRVTTFVSL